MAAHVTTHQILLMVILSASLIHEAYPLSETEVLLKFKASVSDPHFVTNDWTPKTPGSPCVWSGVQCNHGGNVIELSLSYIELSGQIPAELGQLSYLQYLTLNNNTMTGSIPVELGNLKGLLNLNLCCNKFTGKIPAGLGNLPNLVKADFSNNDNLCWDFQPTPKYVGSYNLCPKKQKTRFIFS